MNAIIQYVTFGDWLFFTRNPLEIHLRCPCIHSLFSYCGEGLGGVGGPQSAYPSSTEGPLCCFHFGVTLNTPSMNILCTGLCEHKPSFFSGISGQERACLFLMD